MSDDKTDPDQPCPCGSGKKYRDCCLPKKEAGPAKAEHASFGRYKIRKTESEMLSTLINYAEQRIGGEGVSQAWEEFLLWGDVEIEEDVHSLMEDVFACWLVFAWDVTELLEEKDLIEEDEEDEEPALEAVQEKTIAELCLEEHPGDFDTFQQRYIREAVCQPYSYFQIADVEPGRSMELKDLLMNRTVRVSDLEASKEELKGFILFAKVVSIDGTSVMLGGFPITVPPQYKDEFLNFRSDLEELQGEVTFDLLRKLDLELRELYFYMCHEGQS